MDYTTEQLARDLGSGLNQQSKGSRQTPNAAGQSERRFDAVSWMERLSNSLHMARGIKLPDDRYAFFLTQLTEYTPEQAAGAQAWITRGDWTYKGARGTLELSDFYPTTAQLDSVKTPDTRLLTSGELRRICEQYREYGRQDERERLSKYEQDLKGGKRVFNNDESIVDNLNAEISALRLLLGKLRTQHAALAARGFAEIMEFEEWYAALNEAVVGIAKNDHKRRAFLAVLSADRLWEEMPEVA